MTDADCAAPIAVDALVAWWLGELSPAEEASLDEHLFGCAHCAGRLEQLAALADGIRAVVRDGDVQAIITPAVLQHMRRQGMRLREYRLAPGEHVACTITAADDAVVSRLVAPLADVARVDALASLDLGDGRVQEWRFEDVPFDRSAGEVVALPSATQLRALPAHRFHLRLLAVEQGGERPLGDYTFLHTPG